MKNSSSTSPFSRPKSINLSPVKTSTHVQSADSLSEENEISSIPSFTKIMTATTNKIIKLRSTTPVNPIQLSRERERYSHLLSKVFDDSNSSPTKNISPWNSNQKLPRLPQTTSSKQIRRADSLSPSRVSSRPLFSPDKSFSSVLPSGTAISNNMSKIDLIPPDDIIEPSQMVLTNEVLEELKSSKPKYQFSSTDSKFSEIQTLRLQNMQLAQRNAILKREVKHLDEFKLALMKEVATENFQQKRIDLLKAQISSQRRYINTITSFLKLSREFFCDMKNVLNFLVEAYEKRTKSGQTSTLDQMLDPEIAENKHAVETVLKQIVKSHKGFEDFKFFLSNFNTLFTNLKLLRQDDIDFHQVFEVMRDVRNQSGDQEPEDIGNLNSSSQKKVRYKQVITEFLKKYGDLFQLNSVFHNFEYQDQASFSGFLKALIKSASRVDEILSKLSRFDIGGTNPIVSKANLPKIIRENVVAFSNYLNLENKLNRTILDKDYIDKLESMLSDLLSQVISLHRVLSTEKDSLLAFDVIKLQDSLRVTIEQLICAGIATDANPQKNTLLVLEKLKKQVRWSPENIFDPEKKDLKQEIDRINLGILEREDINRANTDSVIKACKESLRKLDEQITAMKIEQKSGCENTLRKLAWEVDFLITRNSELMAINRLNTMELAYNKEYIALVSSDVKVLKGKLEEKSRKIENFFGGIYEDLKRLEKGYELFAKGKGEDRSFEDKEKFYHKMIKAIAATLKSIDTVFNDESSPFFAEVRKLDEKFSRELENIKQDLLYYSKRRAEMTS